MSIEEDDFEGSLESNYYINLPYDFDPSNHEEVQMSPCFLQISAHRCIDKNSANIVFRWMGLDKYIGAGGRVETYELNEECLREWAEKIRIGFCSECGACLPEDNFLCSKCD